MLLFRKSPMSICLSYITYPLIHKHNIKYKHFNCYMIQFWIDILIYGQLYFGYRNITI